MSHEISITNGSASYAGRLPAWHRLGTVFDRPMTPIEAMAAANLANWNVRTVGEVSAVELTDDGVEVIGMPDRRAVVFTNPLTGKTQYLGDVGTQFTPVQNEDSVDFLQALLDEGGAFIETAGALAEYKRVFFTAKIPHSMNIGGVDPIDLYLAALNGHEGSMAFKMIVTPVRIVCANTEYAALRQAKQTWSRSHRTGVTKAVSDARQSLDLTFKYADAFEAEAEKMINQTITNGQFDEIVTKLYGAPNASDSKLVGTRKTERLEVIRGIYFNAPTQEKIRGTRWGAYNALTEYEDWSAKVRGSDDAAKETARAERAIDHRGVTRKLAAWDLLKV